MAEFNTTGDWFFAGAGTQQGPVSAGELARQLSTGELSPDALVWREGMPQWQPARALAAELGVTVAPPPRVVPPPMPAHAAYPPRGGYPPGHAPPGAQPIGYATPYQQGPPGQQQGIAADPGMRWLLPVGRSGWAIAAGYLGLFSFILFPAPIALVISIIAIRDMKKHPERHGMGRAIFGLIMGVLGTVALCAMLFAVAGSPRR